MAILKAILHGFKGYILYRFSMQQLEKLDFVIQLMNCFVTRVIISNTEEKRLFLGGIGLRPSCQSSEVPKLSKVVLLF